MKKIALAFLLIGASMQAAEDGDQNAMAEGEEQVSFILSTLQRHKWKIIGGVAALVTAKYFSDKIDDINDCMHDQGRSVREAILMTRMREIPIKQDIGLTPQFDRYW